MVNLFGGKGKNYARKAADYKGHQRCLLQK
jgi:hypothetical protein